LSNRLHHRHVLVHALETAGIVSVEGKSLRLEPGQALLILPYQFHHYIHLDADSLNWLFVTFELTQGEESLQPLGHQPMQLERECLELLGRLLDRWQALEPELLPMLDRLLMRLVRTLPLRRGAEAGERDRVRNPDDWIAKAESLIIRSVAENRDLESVAEAVGISSRHLRTRFEAATGVSPSDYRSGYQFSRSIALMQNTEMRFGEIAELCGFHSQSVFNRFIRRRTRQSPKQIRQSLKSQSQ